MNDAQAQINALKPCIVCGSPVGRIAGAGRGRVTCERTECHRERRSALRKARRQAAHVTKWGNEEERLASELSGLRSQLDDRASVLGFLADVKSGRLAVFLNKRTPKNPKRAVSEGTPGEAKP